MIKSLLKVIGLNILIWVVLTAIFYFSPYLLNKISPKHFLFWQEFIFCLLAVIHLSLNFYFLNRFEKINRFISVMLILWVVMVYLVEAWYLGYMFYLKE